MKSMMARKEIERLKDLDTDNFKVITAINLENSLNCVQSEQTKEYHFCPAAHMRTLICPSGVYVCPYWRGKDPFRIGNARENSLSDIWHSKRRKQVMDMLDPSTVCNFHCLRDETNREIIRMLDMKPEEIELVEEYDRFF